MGKAGKGKKKGKDSKHDKAEERALRAALRAKGKGKSGKGKGGASAYSSSREQLAKIGLRIQEVDGDGNCFFRAVGDQVSSEADHAELRAKCIDHIEANRTDFEPFVEDDEDFDDYVTRMRKDGQWAGHLEVQAMGCVLGVNLHIHQEDGPALVSENFKGARTLHLFYLGEQHYDSVRLAGDNARDEPAKEITIGKDGLATGAGGSRAVEEAAAGDEAANSVADGGSVAGEGQDVAGDGGVHAGGAAPEEGGAEQGVARDDAGGGGAKKPPAGRPLGRNKACPCGSGLKAKNCCSTKAARRKAKAQPETRAPAEEEEEEPVVGGARVLRI